MLEAQEELSLCKRWGETSKRHYLTCPPVGLLKVYKWSDLQVPWPVNPTKKLVGPMFPIPSLLAPLCIQGSAPALNRLNDPNTIQAVSARCCAHLWHLGSPFAWRLELVDMSERNAQGGAKGSANASLLHLPWCNVTAGDLCHIQCSPAGRRHPCLFNPL